jgi:hypothetical protein
VTAPPPGGQLDLHGFTVAEAIERFVEQYNLRVKHGQLGCWTVVHGYGSSGAGGAIRNRIRGLLHHHRDNLRYEPGDQYGNPGWTWVYPKLPLPDRQERLATEILGYCSAPKAEHKIVAKFAGHGGIQVKEAVRSLVKQGRLTATSSGMKAMYQARG